MHVLGLRRAAPAVLAVSLLIGAQTAAEEASPLSPAFGNTIVMTYPDGRSGELWLRADGGYAGEGRRGDPSSGRWHFKDGRLCLRQSRPIPFLSYCTPLPSSFRTEWSAKAATGEPIHVSLVRGHVEGPSARAARNQP